MKVLMLSNQTRSMAIFWRVLINTMQKAGMEVICCIPPGDSASEAALSKIGARIINYELDRKGLNPIKDLRTFTCLKNIFKQQKPDFLFATTIKPVIYGCLAAKMTGIPKIFATITGLGYTFEQDTLPKKIINRITRLLYRISLRNIKGIFFQNRDDLAIFQQQNILTPNAPVLSAKGTGVDTNYFADRPLPKDKPFTFLLVCRLLEAKGIAEFAAAAKILKKDFPQARFQLLGPPESGPGSITQAELAKWQESIEYLGQTEDIRPFLADAHVAVLPSWREGLPTYLMEAMSMGRPLIATDVPGCRDLVEDKNGFLVKVKDPTSLATAMRKFLESPGLAQAMGSHSRKLAVEKYDARHVAEGILNDMIGDRQ